MKGKMKGKTTQNVTFSFRCSFLWRFYTENLSKLFTIKCQQLISNLNLPSGHIINISIILNSTDILFCYNPGTVDIAQPVGLKCISSINQVH